VLISYVHLGPPHILHFTLLGNFLKSHLLALSQSMFMASAEHSLSIPGLGNYRNDGTFKESDGPLGDATLARDCGYKESHEITGVVDTDFEKTTTQCGSRTLDLTLPHHI
jgi:hypothetical protein